MQFFIIIGIGLYFFFVTKDYFEKIKDCKCSALIKELTLGKALTFISIDYVFTKKVKGESKGINRKKIIQKRNKFNFIASFIFMACSFLVFIFCEVDVLTYILLGFNGYRFISRSLEIIIAFSSDSLNENGNKSGLNKEERINLAIWSYFEICIYSASFYVTIINNSGWLLILKSLLMSLSVGTLTNVGYIQDKSLLPFEVLQLLPFLQVFATLSLVILSLTIYVSRKD